MARDMNGPGEHAVVVGTYKWHGIALTGDDGVMLSPSAYLALTHQVPPIWRVLSWPLPTIKTCMITDAPANREVTLQQSVKTNNNHTIDSGVVGDTGLHILNMGVSPPVNLVHGSNAPVTLTSATPTEPKLNNLANLSEC
ncbi:hypothetical protein FRC11_011736 [Ceratobasidium sp. 423]|nr:hypothetical protein FRC11_011736 [Ceratobasidium sp. 423]